jgi:hypothetical protein
MFEAMKLISGAVSLTYGELFAPPVDGIPRLEPSIALLIRCKSASLLLKHPEGIGAITFPLLLSCFWSHVPEERNTALKVAHGIFDRAEVGPRQEVISRRRAEKAAWEVCAFYRGVVLICPETARLVFELSTDPLVEIVLSCFGTTFVDEVAECKRPPFFVAEEALIIRDVRTQLEAANDLRGQGRISAANELVRREFNFTVPRLRAALRLGERSPAGESGLADE